LIGLGLNTKVIAIWRVAIGASVFLLLLLVVFLMAAGGLGCAVQNGEFVLIRGSVVKPVNQSIGCIYYSIQILVFILTPVVVAMGVFLAPLQGGWRVLVVRLLSFRPIEMIQSMFFSIVLVIAVLIITDLLRIIISS
jgi:hypothetical protein